MDRRMNRRRFGILNYEGLGQGTERSMANNNVLLDGDPFQPGVLVHSNIIQRKNSSQIHLVLEFYINAVAAGD